MALLRLPALPTHAAGLPLAEAARSLGAYVLAAAGLQTAVTVGVRGTRFEKNVRNAAGDGDAAPLFSYLVCLVAQSTLFPALLALSVAQFPGLHAHCTATFAACDAAGGTCWMRVLAFVLVAYLCKDLHLCDAMELLHHAAGIVVTSGFMLQKRGMFGYVTGCMALEFANFFMNLATVWPYRASRRRAYLASVVAMSVSHVVGAYVAPVTRPPSRVADEAEPPPRPLSPPLSGTSRTSPSCRATPRTARRSSRCSRSRRARSCTCGRTSTGGITAPCARGTAGPRGRRIERRREQISTTCSQVSSSTKHAEVGGLSS